MKITVRLVRLLTAVAFAGGLLLPRTDAFAEDTPATRLAKDLVTDTKLYFTAPARWDGQDWLYFTGSLAAIGVAHHYDDSVYSHFATGSSTNAANDSHSIGDAAPAAAAFVGTWVYASLIHSSAGRRETWTMAEAVGLSAVSGLALKFIAGRKRPYETTNVNDWRAGGDSFPSLHTTAAFAIGTVLAESGNDDYRWIRRTIGYGIGAGTAYLRLKHNQHWLSDTVAGMALGMSTAHFAMHRGDERHSGRIAVTPIDGGIALTYMVALH